MYIYISNNLQDFRCLVKFIPQIKANKVLGAIQQPTAKYYNPTKPIVSSYKIMNTRSQDFQVGHNNVIPSQEVTDELILVLGECLEKVDKMNRGSLLLKFFSELMEKEMNLEGFIMNRLSQSNVKAISELCKNLPSTAGRDFNSTHLTTSAGQNYCYTTMRGLHGYEVEEKLERFNVKTVYIGGVVNGENK